MPIKPENRAKYPANWKDIRRSILSRASHRCEKCGLLNGWIGYRDDGGKFHFVASWGNVKDWEGHATGFHLIKIVLTIAHLDHSPENCDPSNLRAWCQKCHLTHDAAHHATNARATRRTRKAAGELFGMDALTPEQHMKAHSGE